MSRWSEVARGAVERGSGYHPAELARALDRVAEIQPRTLLEVGCSPGGGLFAWAAVAHYVFGVDLVEPESTHYATVLVGDSHKLDLAMQLRSLIPGTPGTKRLDVLVLDGGHSYNDVMVDWLTYQPWVRSGGLVLVHGIKSDWAGITRFWSEVEADTWWELVQPGAHQGVGVIRVP